MEQRKHPVIDLMLERHRTGYDARGPGDGYKLGLVWEGGGMRGVISAGMGLALVQLGLPAVFDAVYGASAGAMNSAYFVSGQGWYGITIYYDDLSSRRFASVARALAGRSIVSLDYLEEVMRRRKPLDCRSIIDSATKLKIIASSLTRRAPVVLQDFQTPDGIFAALRASALLPRVAGPPVQLAGDLLVDASMYSSFPDVIAHQDGCTHILILLSRPAGQVRAAASSLERWYIAKYLRRFGDQLYEDYIARADQYHIDLTRVLNATRNTTPAPYIYAIQVPEDIGIVHQLETSHERLVAGATAGMKAAMRVILGHDSEIMEVLLAFSPDGRKEHI
jgi:predicted patatin/cPLA2 family phospholipase